MKNHILLTCLYLLGCMAIHTQEFLPPPVTQSIFANGDPLDTEAFETVLPTSDGGHMLIGTFIFNDLRYGLILKFDQNGNYDWLLNYGNTQNSLSNVYFYDAVEANGLVYIVGDGILNGIRYPFTTTVTLGGTGGGVAFYSGLAAGKGLAIERTFNNTLLIGGYTLDGQPDNGDTQGYVRQIGLDQNTIGSTLLTGSKIGEIARNDISGGYYAFGTYYDPFQDGCDDGPQFSGNTPVGSDRSDIYVARISNSFNLSWQRFIGGESSDTFLDGVVANDGGFAVLAFAECESFFGDDGPLNVCYDSGEFQPYWFYKGTSGGTFDWARSVDSYGFFDAVQTPFGITPACSDDLYIVGNNVSGLSGSHISLDQLAETGNQQFLDGTFDGSVELYGGQEITRNLSNQIIIGGTNFDETTDLAYFRFSEETSCCPAPTFNYNCAPNLSYSYNGFGLDYQFTVQDENNYLANEDWYVNGQPVTSFGTSIDYEFFTPDQYEVCYPTEDNDGCLSYCCEVFCIDFQDDCLDGVIPPCPGQCACVETDLNLPSPFQCETFDNYQDGALTPQSGFWRIWPSQADANVEDVDGDKVLHLVSATPEQDVVYDLFSGTADNLYCGRYRLSWELTVVPTSGAYYNLQYDKNELGQNSNFAYEVFFNPDGTGYVTNGVDPQRSFSYLVGIPIQVMQIIDLDQNDGIMEFWLNGDFKFEIDYGARAIAEGENVALGAIDFFADSQSNIDFQIDDICIRASEDPFGCGDPTEPVCVENGEQYDNICRANRLGLYAIGEFEECLSICEFNAEFIGRDEQTNLNATLTVADEAPSLLLSESCVASAYGGEVPFPFYTDIFIIENTASQPININPTDFGPQANAFVFQCNPDMNGNFTQSCLGSYLDIQGQDQAPGIYYILVTSSEAENYGIIVTPSTDCVTAGVPILSCTNNTYTGGFPSAQNNFAAVNGNDAYSDCYAGLRTYELSEQAFRLEISEASLVDITLTTTNGAAGVFVYNSSCGNDCVNYAEAPDDGGVVQLSDLTLAPGNYYLVVDQETAVSQFTLDVACQTDDNNEGQGGTFTINGVNPPDCEVSDEFHNVAIQIDNTTDYVVGDDRFSFNLPQGGLYNTMLGQAYNGNETLVFDLPPNTGAEPCSFLPGDSMQLFIYKPNESAITTFRQVANYAPVSPGVDAEGRFTPNATSVITDYTALNTIFISFPTSYAFPPEASAQLSFWQIAGPWQAEVSDSWISVDPLEGENNQVITIAVSENTTYASREGSITVTTTTEPFVSQTIQIIQRGRCALPQLLPGTQEFVICQGEMASLNILDVGPGPDSVYAYQWSTGETTSSVTVSPTETSTYTVTVSQVPGDYCRASSTSTFTVVVNAAVPQPTTTAPQTTICSGTTFPTLTVDVDESLYLVNWYDSPSGGALLQANSLSYTPDNSGVFYAEAVDLENTNCRSTRLPLTVNTVPQITINTSWQDTMVCLGSPLSITAQAGGGSGALSYRWFDQIGDIVSFTDTYDFIASPIGQIIYTLEVSDADGFCQSIEDVYVEIQDLPNFSNFTPPDDSNCTADLDFYSFTFSVNGDLQAPADGILVDLGDGNYRLEAIPVGTDITLSATSGLCSNSLQVTSPSCACPGDINAPENNGDERSCAGEEYPALSVSIEDPDAYGVNWYNEDNELVAENTLIYTPLVPGTYSTRSYLRTAPACLSSSTLVSLTEVPMIELSTFWQDTTVCVNSPLTVAAQGLGGDGTLTYNWFDQDDNLISSINSFNYTPANVGTTTFTLEVDDETGTCQATEMVQVQVLALPTFGNYSAPDEDSCTPDLSAYSISFSTNAQLQTPTAGTLIDQGGGNYLLENIPVGTDLILTTTNEICSTDLVVESPSCTCQAITDIPQSDGNQTSCAGDEYPTLSVSVEDPATYGVNWYDSNGTLVAENTLIYQPEAPGTYFTRSYLRVAPTCLSDNSVPITLQEVGAITVNTNQEEEVINTCIGETITFIAAAAGGDGPLSYEWRQDDLVLSSTSFLNYTASQEESIVIDLLVADENGTCTASRNFTINIAAQPTISTGLQVCSDDLSTYSIDIVTTNTDLLTTNLPSAIVDDLGGGNYQISNIPVDNGIVLTASNSFDVATCDETITINAPQDCNCASMPVPLAEPVQAVYATCIGDAFPQLSVENPGDEYQVEWYNTTNDDDPFLTGALNFTPAEEGTFYVLLRHIENLCTSTSFTEIEFVINELPTAEAGDNVEVCAGTSVILDAQSGSSGNGPLTYAWSPGSQLDDPESGTPVATIETQEVLTLTVTDANQCSATDVLILTPLLVPEADINVLQSIDCFGDSTGILQAVVSGGTLPNQLTWSNGEENIAVISNLSAGDYQLVVIDANNCADSITVGLNQPPEIILFESTITPVIVEDGNVMPGEVTVVITGGSPDYSYSWLDMAGVVQSTTAGGFTTEEEVTYDLLITDANGCQVIFPGFVVDLIVGTSTLPDLQEQIFLYPNPTTGLLQLRLAKGTKQDVDIYIYNVLGQLMGQSQIPQLSEQSVALDISYLPSGSYTIQLRVEEQPYNFKVLKIR